MLDFANPAESYVSVFASGNPPLGMMHGSSWNDEMSNSRLIWTRAFMEPIIFPILCRQPKSPWKDINFLQRKGFGNEAYPREWDASNV